MSLRKAAQSTRVLIVEDEWLIADQIEAVVRRQGYDVVGPVPTVALALTLVETAQISIAILDVNLLNGEKSFPIAHVLTERGIPFLFLTGYLKIDFPAEFMTPAILGKPFDDDLLAQHIKALLIA